MTTYAPFDRDQPFLLPPDLKDWLPEDDLAHFIVAAAERVRLGAFRTNRQAGGKPQYHPPLMLALVVCCYAKGGFSSRGLVGGTYRDIGARFIAANTHPDHATIATFRRTNKAAFEAAFLEVLLPAREWGVEARRRLHPAGSRGQGAARGRPADRRAGQPANQVVSTAGLVRASSSIV